MEERGLSQSGISIYRDCPYAYKLHYVDLREPIFYSPSALDIGKFVHDSIDKYYKNNFLTEGTSEDILFKTYKNFKENDEVRYLLPEQLKKAYDCLTHHSLWEENNINNIATNPMSEVEINGAGYYGWIDYIDIQNDKVIDFKTNTYPTLSYAYRMQAHIYRELFESKFKKKLTHFYFFFLYPNTWRTVKYDSEKQKKVGQDVENFKELILNKEYPKKPRTKSQCKSCEYRYYCRVLE